MLNVDLYNRLTTKTNITNLLGSIGNNFSVFPLKMPEKRSFPAITYQIITQTYDHGLLGASGLVEAIVSIDCYSLDYPSVTSVSEAVRNAFDGIDHRFMGDTFIENMFLEPGDSEDLIISEDKSQEDLYHIGMEFTTWYQQEKPNDLT